MGLKQKKITVIGAGIGGLAVARALAMRGAEVTVLEQADAITEVGAGLQISPNGFCVLDALGLGPAIKECSVQGEAVQLRDYRGGRVVELDLKQLEDRRYYFVHRSDIIGVLADGARDAGVKIRLSQQVKSVQLGENPEVELTNGDCVASDILIGADGLHSVLRRAMNGTSAPFFTRQVAWRTVIPNRFGRTSEAVVHMGPGRHLVSYPLRDGAFLNIVAVQERMDWAEEGWNLRDDPANLRAAFADFGGDVPAMLAAVEDVHLWGLFRHPVAKVWHQGAAAILGDAAHPTLPFLAQGAVMALEDSWVLAESLENADDIMGGLANYQQRRVARATRVINAATGNARKYHLRSAPVRFAAHMALRIGGKIAPSQMMHQFDWLYGMDVTA
ncbi:MAG: FAD-dependent monooxygenase [Rhodobacterales bacterium]|nr:FAD-dependent monooxygenase [Rhodobacterales bacterium]